MNRNDLKELRLLWDTERYCTSVDQLQKGGQMMQVRFSATGRLKAKTGVEGLLLDLPTGASVTDALHAASDRLGSEGSILGNGSGSVRFANIVVVNDEIVMRDDMDKALHEGDEGMLLMPMSGG